MSEKQIVVFAPRYTQLERALYPYFAELDCVPKIDAHVLSCIEAPDTEAFIFYSTDLLRDGIDLQASRWRKALEGKLLFQIGPADEAVLRSLVQAGMAGVFSYNDTVYFPTNPMEEYGAVFRRAIELMAAGTRPPDILSRLVEEIQTSADALARSDFAAAIWLDDQAQTVRYTGSPAWGGFGPCNLQLLTTPEHAARTPRIQVIEITPLVLRWLQTDPARMAELPADKFEELVAERISAMGFKVQKAGKTFQKDGGIDLLACPTNTPFRYVLAVQVKQRRSTGKIPVRAIREFRGAMQSLPVSFGVVVTNGAFTRAAIEVASQFPLVLLKDFKDLRRWLANEFISLNELVDLPSHITLAPGLTVPIPWDFAGEEPEP